MTDLIESIFSARGRLLPAITPEARAALLPDRFDEQLAAYLDGGLAASERTTFETQVLQSPEAFELFRAAVDGIGLRHAPSDGSFRILARIQARGLAVLNAFELRFWAMVDGSFQPALGALRGGAVAEPDLLTVLGPGDGLDEIDLQLQADGTTRVEVRAHRQPDVESDESVSIVLETDGQVREKRPFDGDRAVFVGLDTGRHVVRLVARAPGKPGRPLVEAELILRD